MDNTDQLLEAKLAEITSIDAVATTGSNSVTLTWSPVAEAAYYKIETSDDCYCNYKTLRFAHESTQYVHRISNTKTTYFYRIMAFDAEGNWLGQTVHPVEVTPEMFDKPSLAAPSLTYTLDWGDAISINIKRERAVSADTARLLCANVHFIPHFDMIQYDQVSIMYPLGSD